MNEMHVPDDQYPLGNPLTLQMVDTVHTLAGHPGALVLHSGRAVEPD